MHRNVTAVYRTREVADLVRRGLEETGISAGDIHVIPDPAHDTPADRAAGTGRPAGMGAGAAPAGTTTAGARAGAMPGAMPGDATAAGGAYPLQGASYAEDPSHSDRLHELHLPEDDLRSYQHAIRRGDYVVSVEVDDDRHDLDKVAKIMRRPEEEISRLGDDDAGLSGATVVPHSRGDAFVADEDVRARRADSPYDPFARTYERDAPLRGRREP